MIFLTTFISMDFQIRKLITYFLASTFWLWFIFLCFHILILCFENFYKKGKSVLLNFDLRCVKRLTSQIVSVQILTVGATEM